MRSGAPANPTRRRAWIGAVLLVGVIAGLLVLYLHEDDTPPREHTSVSSEDTPPPPSPELSSRPEPRVSTPGAQAPEPRRATAAGPTRELVVAALPGGGRSSALVIQADSLRRSPVGGLLIDCLQRQGAAPLALFRERTGVDLTEDLQQVAVSPEAVVFGGRFDRARFESLFEQAGMSPRAYGTDGAIYQAPEPRTWVGPDGRTVEIQEAWGTWRGQILVLGLGAGEVERAIDRLEGRLSEGAPAIPPDLAAGEVYGVLRPTDALRFIPPEQDALRNSLEQLGQVELRLDTSRDVQLRADLRGADPARLAELTRLLQTGLVFARGQARAEGQAQLADLLEQARLNASNGALTLEVGLPLTFVEERLSFCQY